MTVKKRVNTYQKKTKREELEEDFYEDGNESLLMMMTWSLRDRIAGVFDSFMPSLFGKPLLEKKDLIFSLKLPPSPMIL